MLIIPAIDIRGGKCVRLRQGDYGQETVFGDDPAALARHWVEQGATYLHLVDLDGAKAGRPVNQEAIQRIIKAAGVPCQLGGGLRAQTHLQTTFEGGIDRCVIGTQALKSPDWFAAMCEKFPGKLLLGLDAKQGRLATEGWLEVTENRAIDVARRFDPLSIAGFVYTDIAKDGMMEGPNLPAISELQAATTRPVIASGGVTTLKDIADLLRLSVAGCIVGRALYEGTLNLPEAMELIQRGGATEFS